VNDVLLFSLHAIFIFISIVNQVVVEGETTTADNNSILPSKKRTTRSIHQTTTPIKRKLSKKERKRLEKVVDLKKKKAQVSISNQSFRLILSLLASRITR
jgi:DNA replicative helicase MCM subunit Mcm2 (Cdc46/Mcm family)